MAATEASGMAIIRSTDTGLYTTVTTPWSDAAKAIHVIVFRLRKKESAMRQKRYRRRASTNHQ